MSKKVVVLSLMTSAVLNLSNSFIEKFKNTSNVQLSEQRLELIPVKYTDKSSKHSLEFKNSSLLPLTRKPVVSVDGFKYQGFSDDKLGLRVFLDDKATKEISTASKKYPNQRLAVVLDGKVISTPRVVDSGSNGLIDLDLSAQSNFENLLDELNV
jgi:preprotein translocase subunit SecD